MRWAKIAGALCLAAFLGYFLIDQQPRPNGGSWYGYTLGPIGLGLIVWLSLLGVRKRDMSEGRWSLKAWTSAHVYLALSLIVIATARSAQRRRGKSVSVRVDLGGRPIIQKRKKINKITPNQS